MKVLNSSHITLFDGLNFVLNEFHTLKMGDLLSDYLPKLAEQSHYHWKELLYSFWSIYFCGGDCIEDLGNNFHGHLKDSILLYPPSPDRVLTRFKQLSLPKEITK